MLVKELLLNNLWKKSKATFENKIHFNLDFIAFKENQFKQGRLIKDDEYFVETGKTRFIAQDTKTLKRYNPTINWSCLDTEDK